MKKFLFAAALATAAFCSCNKQQSGLDYQTLTNGVDTPIAFDNYVNQTKSTTLNADSVKTLGFGVFAFSQEQIYLKEFAKSNYAPNFMYNQKVTNDGTGWAYSPVKYWPNNPGAMVSFFAYAPYIAKLNDDKYTITPDTNTYLQDVVPTDPEGLRLVLGYDYNGPGIEYNVPADPTKGVDLMWGQEKDSQYCPCDKSKPGIDEKISFVFKHALSRLEFDLQVLVDTTDYTENNPIAENTKIKVKSVSLKGNFASKGTLRLYDGTWNISNTDYTNIVFAEGMNQFSEAVENYITGDIAKEPIALLAGTETPEEEKNNYMMLIPGAKFYIEVVYEVTTEDSTNPKNNSVVVNTIRSYDNNAKVTPATTDGYFTLKQGNAYNFHLVLGMTSVKFEAEVEDWIDLDNEYVVDLPNNTKAN